MSGIQQHLIPDLKAYGATALIECRLAAVLMFLEERPYLARHVVHELGDSRAAGRRGYRRLQRCRKRSARMLTAVGVELGESSAQRRCRNIDGEFHEWEEGRPIILLLRDEGAEHW